MTSFQELQISVDYGKKIQRKVKKYFGEKEEYGYSLSGDPQLLLCVDDTVERYEEWCCQYIDGQLDISEQEALTYLEQLRGFHRLRDKVASALAEALYSFGSDALVPILKTCYGRQ